VENADLCYLVDETTAEIDTSPYHKIPFSVRRFADLGLATVDEVGRGEVWWNGDYPLYVAYLKYPAYRFYWMIEYDVLINYSDYNEFFAKFESIELDLIGSPLYIGAEGWAWYAAAARMFAEVWGMFFPMMRLSNRAVSYALCRRLIRSHQYREAAPAERIWPHCEAWLASELCGNGAFTWADMNSLGTTYYQWLHEYGSRPHLLEDLAARPEDGRIYHPVLTGRDYIDKAYYWYVVRTHGRDAKEVRTFLDSLERLRQPELAEDARRQLVRALNYPELEFFRAEVLTESLIRRRWRFGRADGTTIAEAMVFLPDGTIDGHAHPNENRWAISDGHLLLFGEDDVVTTDFDEACTSSEGKLLLRGKYTLGPDVVHILEEDAMTAAADAQTGGAC
jgi:hypothetical protein